MKKSYDEWKITNPEDEELGPEPVEDTEPGGAYRAIIRQQKTEIARLNAFIARSPAISDTHDCELKELITKLANSAALYLSLDGSDKVYDAVKLQGARVKLREEIQRVREATQ